MWACSHVYEGLFLLDSNASLSPLLADSFWVEPNQLYYHFLIKKNVYFHKNSCFRNADSTRRLSAKDVQYSFERLLDYKTASPGAWVMKNKLDSLRPFQIVDSFHLVIRLQKANAQFSQVLSMPYCAVIPKEAVEFYGKNFRKNPVGTGPFTFKLWEDGEVLFLKKNEHYHLNDKIGLKLPYLDYVKITFNENKKTELFSFEKKELSFISGPDQSIIQQVFDRKGNPKGEWKNKAQIYKKPFLNTEYMAILVRADMLKKNSVMRHKKLRQAINYSICREELAEHLKYNLVLPANKGFISYGMPNYDTNFTGYRYNLEKAKTLIAEAGYSDKNRPKLDIHINNSFVEMSELLAYQLSKAGFEVEIKLHPADMMMQLAAAGKLEFFRRSWFADYPDAENYFACFYSKNSTPPNYTRFSNPIFDKLYEEVCSETNAKNRKLKYKEMEQILIDESPIVPIFYDQSIRIVQKNVSGLEQNVLNTLDLRKVVIGN